MPATLKQMFVVQDILEKYGLHVFFFDESYKQYKRNARLPKKATVKKFKEALFGNSKANIAFNDPFREDSGNKRIEYIQLECGAYQLKEVMRLKRRQINDLARANDELEKDLEDLSEQIEESFEDDETNENEWLLDYIESIEYRVKDEIPDGDSKNLLIRNLDILRNRVKTGEVEDVENMLFALIKTMHQIINNK